MTPWSFGNSTTTWLDVKLSNEPPVVELEAITSAADYTLDETYMNTYVIGRMKDASGIDFNKTNLWLDSINVNTSGISDYDCYGKDFPASVRWWGILEEGMHFARIQAADNLGLISEDSISFNVSFAPKICPGPLPQSIQFTNLGMLSKLTIPLPGALP